MTTTVAVEATSPGPPRGTHPLFESRDRDDSSTDAGALRHRYDWDATRASTAVVEMVAIAADVEPSALEPLYDTVDPEALDALIGRSGAAGIHTEVGFTYAGFDVTVGGDGEVTVAPARPTAEE